jgi:hypothetical protein
MAKTTFAIQSSAAQTATGNGGAIAVSGVSALSVVVDVTTASGSLSVFLQSSMDGTNWADIPYDLALTSASTTFTEGTRRIAGVNTTQSTGNNRGDGGCRNIVELNTAAVIRSFARYTIFGNSIRAAWVIANTASGSTFSVLAIGQS